MQLSQLILGLLKQRECGQGMRCEVAVLFTDLTEAYLGNYASQHHGYNKHQVAHHHFAAN